MSEIADVGSVAQAPPVQLFQGYDTFLSAGRSTAVSGTSRNAGATAESYYQVCYDYSELQQALNISASASASFGFGSVSAKTTFSESLKVTNTSVTIVVYSNIVTNSDTYTNVQLDVAPPADINAFFQVYGDSFVNQLVQGAEYIATYVFYSESVDQQKSLEAEFAANGITSGGSLSTNLQTSLEQVQKNTSTRQELKQFVSGFTHIQLPDSDHIIDFALAFPNLTPDAPVVTSYQTLGYEHVPNMPASFSSVVANRVLFEGYGAQPGLSDDYATLSAVQNEIDWLDSVYAVYNYNADTLLAQRSVQVDADIKTLDQLFLAMDADPTAAYVAPSLEALTYGTPQLNCQLQVLGPYGGNGGGTFIQASEETLNESAHLTQISMRGGSYVDRLSTTYQSDAGNTSYNQGGSGGSQSPTMLLQSGERVIHIEGTYGSYVNSLIFTTNYGNTLKWPPSPKSAPNKIEWIEESNTALLGFDGRSGEYLDAISLVVANFSPAQWVAYQDPVALQEPRTIIPPLHPEAPRIRV